MKQTLHIQGNGETQWYMLWHGYTTILIVSSICGIKPLGLVERPFHGKPSNYKDCEAIGETKICNENGSRLKILTA